MKIASRSDILLTAKGEAPIERSTPSRKRASFCFGSLGFC
jgi:hypothetical protein